MNSSTPPAGVPAAPGKKKPGDLELADLPAELQSTIRRTIGDRSVTRIIKATGTGSPDGGLCYKVITARPDNRQAAFVMMPDGRFDHRVDLKLTATELPGPVATALTAIQRDRVIEKCDRVHFPSRQWEYYRIKFADGSAVRLEVDGRIIQQPGLE